MSRGGLVKASNVLGAAAAVVVLALPAAAAARTTTLKGTVVAHDTHRGAWVVANAKGQLEVVRTKVRLKVGWKVTISGKLQASGVLAASHVRHTGSARTVRIHGVKLAHSRHNATITGGGAAVTVASTGSAPDGAEVETTETISGNSLTGKSEHTVDSSASRTELSGTVTAFLAPAPPTDGSVSLTVEDSTTVVTVVVPAASTATFTVGDEVELRVTITPGAPSPEPVTYTLAAARHDGHDRDRGHHDGLHAEGVLTIPDPADGTVTVTGEHGAVTFTVADATLIAALVTTDCVEARGHQDGTSIVLDSIRKSDECTTEDHEQGDGDHGVNARGALTIGVDAALGTITVDGTIFTIGTVTVDPTLAGACVRAHGTVATDPSAPADLTSIRPCDGGGHGGGGH
jgi:hypothetical protein